MEKYSKKLSVRFTNRLPVLDTYVRRFILSFAYISFFLHEEFFDLLFVGYHTLLIY